MTLVNAIMVASIRFLHWGKVSIGDRGRRRWH